MTNTTNDLAATMRATTECFLQTWTGNWIDALEPNLALRADNCQHTILPSSLNRNNESNEIWASKFSKVMHLLTESTMTTNDYLAVPEDRRVVARSSVEAATPVGPYKNEYVWFLTFDDSGRKVVNVTEFVDALAAKELLGRLKESGYLDEH